MKVIRRILIISLPTFLLMFVILEASVRLFVDVGNMVMSVYDYENDIVHFEPNQSGLNVSTDFVAHHRINAAGWNSIHDYTTDRAEDQRLIAIIGDSYIEAMQVDVEQSVAYVLEDNLNRDAAADHIVYSFGRSGAPLSQYLHIMRMVARTYQPDMVIINIVDNDFQESFRHLQHKPHILQYELTADNRIIELAPQSFELSWGGRLLRLASNSELFRYIWINQRLGQKILVTDDGSQMQLTDPAIGTADNPQLLDTLLDYTFGEFVSIAASTDSELLLVIDGPRQTIYDGLPITQANTSTYHRLVSEYAGRLNMPLIDLGPIFEQDFAANQRLFNFEHDYHWNAYAHQLVGEVIAQHIHDLADLAPEE